MKSLKPYQILPHPVLIQMDHLVCNSMYALNAVREGPVVAGVQVGVDERAGDAVKGGSVVRIL